MARRPRDKARVVERREGESVLGAPSWASRVGVEVPGTVARADRGHGPGRQRRAACGWRRGLPPARGESPLRRRRSWRGTHPDAQERRMAGQGVAAAGSWPWVASRGRVVHLPRGSRRRREGAVAPPGPGPPAAAVGPAPAASASSAGSGSVSGAALVPGGEWTHQVQSGEFVHLCEHIYGRLLCTALHVGPAGRASSAQSPAVLDPGSPPAHPTLLGVERLREVEDQREPQRESGGGRAERMRPRGQTCCRGRVPRGTLRRSAVGPQ